MAQPVHREAGGSRASEMQFRGMPRPGEPAPGFHPPTLENQDFSWRVCRMRTSSKPLLHKPMLSFLMAIAACMMIGCKKHEPVPPPDIRLNPNPTELYRAILKLEGAPEPLRITGATSYIIENPRECVPLDHTMALGGHRPDFNKKEDQSVSRLSDDIYEVKYHLDGVLDENYYGIKTCRWTARTIFSIYTGGSKYSIITNPEEGVVVRMACVIGKGVCLTNEDAIKKAEHSDGYFFATIKVNRE